ncbi:MAG: hypothetical protein RUMPE_01345 [Eubacteriales bacterium SKADARSKE-1]|nr:hypothetical protein [Eubacteriales bacterium SKADARSKE-1]MDQ5984298.1 hypothetical protein [Eubacteriales bacterium SKADARSKE-1]
MGFINQALIVAAGVLIADVLKDLSQLIAEKIKGEKTNKEKSGPWLYKK